MNKDDLLEIIGEDGNLPDFFSRLEKKEIAIRKFRGFDRKYKVVEARREFVILEDLENNHNSFIHPYGTNVIYQLEKL